MIAEQILIFLCGMLLGLLLALLGIWLFSRRESKEQLKREDQMKEAFAALSKETLMANVDLMNSSFKASLEQIYKTSEQDRNSSQEHFSQVVKPLKESLLAVDRKVQEMENLRQGAYSGLHAQIEGLLKSQQILHKETNNLSRALNAPSVRGRWGEMQLRRVVELSGLSQHCDFIEQLSVKSEEELVRPDMIVTLPGDKLIIVDAKAPLEFFGFDEQDDKIKGEKLAQALRRHVLILKKKNYFKVVSKSPDFCVMFLPGEAFLHKALMADPLLLDYASQHDVVVVTPVTLVGLLKAVSFGFRQEAVAGNIEEVRRLSQLLIDRVHKVSEHFNKLGRHLSQATQSFNETLSSLDSRVLVTARKLAELKAITKGVKEEEENTPNFVDVMPREAKLSHENQDAS